MIDSTFSLTGRPVRGVRVTPPARLVQLHRRNLTNVLVMGGTSDQRKQVARSFHRGGLVRGGPFVILDGQRDEESLRASLQSRMSSLECDVPGDVLLASEQGTLFLDSVGSLSKDTQRMLVTCLLSCMNVPHEEHEKPWVGRLIAGNAEHLLLAVDDGCFSELLFDSLDKVRVELARCAQVGVELIESGLAQDRNQEFRGRSASRAGRTRSRPPFGASNLFAKHVRNA